MKAASSILPDNIQTLVLESNELKAEDDVLVLNAIQRSSIVIIDDDVDIEQVFYILRGKTEKYRDAVVEGLHHKVVIQLAKADIDNVTNRNVKSSTNHDNRLEQYNHFVNDLKDWAGFSEDQVN